MPSPSLSKHRVVLEAADLADEVGIQNATLSAVARRLGVKTPSLYSHVRDLASLLDGVTALALADLSDLVASRIAGRSGRDALEGLAESHRALALHHRGRWQALHRRAGPSAVASPAARVLVDLTSSVLIGYGITGNDRVHAVRFIGSTLTGFLTLADIGSFDHSSPDGESSWGVAIAALDAALRNWPSGRTGSVIHSQEGTS